MKDECACSESVEFIGERRDLSSPRSRNKNGTVLSPDSEETALSRAGLRETLEM